MSLPLFKQKNKSVIVAKSTIFIFLAFYYCKLWQNSVKCKKDQRKGEPRTLSKKNNEAFLNYYIELDKVCCAKFGVATGGVGEYINRLNNARFAPNRDDVLPRLVRYRNIHKRFYYEPGAMRKDNEITKDDIKWLARFKRDVEKKKDPISLYLKKAKRYAFKKKVVRYFWIGMVLALVVAGVVLYFALT